VLFVSFVDDSFGGFIIGNHLNRQPVSKASMKHRIDPKIDCVFKALLGSEENRNLLVHFLNAVLVEDLSAPITEAEILNPYNDKEFLDDKLSVVDVKAKDSDGRLYQIEIQLLTYRHLPERMVYTWCDNVGRNKPRNPPAPLCKGGFGGFPSGVSGTSGISPETVVARPYSGLLPKPVMP